VAVAERKRRRRRKKKRRRRIWRERVSSMRFETAEHQHRMSAVRQPARGMINGRWERGGEGRRGEISDAIHAQGART